MAKVPELGRKFELLKRAGLTYDDIGRRLGVKRETVRGWQYGHANRAVDADSVPDRHIPKLVELIAEVLPGSHTPPEARALFIGGVNAFEWALTADSSLSIGDLIAAEGKTGTGLIRRKGSLALVEHVDGSEGPEAVKLDEEFQIEWNIRRPGSFLLVLQHTQQIWGAVRFANGSLSVEHKAGPVLVPGTRDKRIVWMRERIAIGRHRFILFVSPEPFPADILRPAREGTHLDWKALGDLASYYSRQNQHRRELHVLELDVAPRNRIGY